MVLSKNVEIMSFVYAKEDVDVPKKVLEFEEFLNNVLRADLR